MELFELSFACTVAYSNTDLDIPFFVNIFVVWSFLAYELSFKFSQSYFNAFAP